MEKQEQIITTYQQIIQKTELELQNARKRIYYISLLRLILFVGAVANAIIFWSDGWLCLSAFAILPFILFIWLVKRHNFWFYRKDFLKKKIEINGQELRAMQYDFSDFDDGKEFVNPSHLYTLDLDVFGEHSLFQYINRTATPIGKLHLANWFNAHLENKEAIEHRQEAIHELSTDLEYRQQIRLLGLLYKGKPADTTEIKEWANSPSYYRKRTLLRILPTAVTIINFLCIGLAILGIISASIAGGVFVGFVLFSTIFSKGITKLQTTYGEKLQILSTYADQILLTEQKEMQSHILQKLKTIGEIDAYCSLATFAYNHPDYIYPTIAAQSFHLQAEALGHPLMDRNKCVRNGIDIERRPFFIIITGANMAGKSTYLRTVGVNYLLACIGAPVWAKRMEIYPARLVTSLRTSDSLADNESYFFAELKRLKLIIDKLEAGEELFIILDEILKGTNSMDKQKGSFALIKQFMHMNTNGIIATHDLLLGTLVDSFPQNIRNYCFEADITNNELTFSYQMRNGVAQNMNACFLMKKMGIAVIND